MLATERTNGAMKRLVSLRQKENIYSKCWALKSFVTHHPLLRIVINPAFCQTALLKAAQCQKRTSHAKYLWAGCVSCCSSVVLICLSLVPFAFSRSANSLVISAPVISGCRWSVGSLGRLLIYSTPWFRARYLDNHWLNCNKMKWIWSSPDLSFVTTIRTSDFLIDQHLLILSSWMNGLFLSFFVFKS